MFAVVGWILVHYWRRINNFRIILNRVPISRKKVLAFDISFASWTSWCIVLHFLAVLRVVLLSLIHVVALSRVHLFSHGVVELIRFVQLHMARIDLYACINVCLIISWCIVSCFKRILCVWKLRLSAICHVHSGWLIIDSTLATRWHVCKTFLNVGDERQENFTIFGVAFVRSLW